MSNTVMGPIIDHGKVIPRSFGRIYHLSGSKMIDDEDKLIDPAIEIQMTRGAPKSPGDHTQLVIASEKIDGMNASVYKHEGKLYPLVRKGYDCRASKMKWIRAFGQFVEDNLERFDKLLNDGERVCGEWMTKTHTLKYNIPREPFYVFDIIKGTENDTFHYPWVYVYSYADELGFEIPKVAYVGETVNPIIALEKLGKGSAGVVGDKPEGVVLRLEVDGKFVCYAKYVSHPDMGQKDRFKGNDPTIFNNVQMQYEKYLPRE